MLLMDIKAHSHFTYGTAHSIFIDEAFIKCLVLKNVETFEKRQEDELTGLILGLTMFIRPSHRENLNHS